MGLQSIKKLFPCGKAKALTMSYDDGVTQDRKLVEIFNKYGIRGTFNLNSGFLGQEDFFMEDGRKVFHSHINADEVKNLYKNHEVAVHSLTHPNLAELPKEMINFQLMQDKKNLEELVGYPVRGMAYPFSSYDNRVIEVLKSIGIEYSRTVNSHLTYNLPNNYAEWNPTCHHSSVELMGLAKRFVENSCTDDIALFYVWGHSYEFDFHDNWNIIEEFCHYLNAHPDIWYATNIEIVDYLNAINRLIYSSTGSSLYNPSGLDVWIKADETVVRVGKGETILL